MNKGKNVLVLSNDQKNKIFRSDTEYGKTLDEIDYKFLNEKNSLSIDTIVPLYKFSQMEKSDTDVFHLAGFGGEDNRTIFNIIYDTRDPIQIVKSDSSKQYAPKVKFTSISTSVDGYAVTGDEHGCIRIYNDLSKNAISKIDGYEGISSNPTLYPKGDPVIGIDISTNREWVVWTTPTFLVVAHFKDTSAWEKSKMGKVEHIMQLVISEEHLSQFNITEYQFLPAKFDIGPSSDLKKKEITESFIFSYIGNYRVYWNMRKVAKDYKDEKSVSYGTITKLEDKVIDYAPEYGRPGLKESVIALEDRVKHLKINE